MLFRSVVGGDLGGVSAGGTGGINLTTNTVLGQTGVFFSTLSGVGGTINLHGGSGVTIKAGTNTFTVLATNANGSLHGHTEGNNLVIDNLSLTQTGGTGAGIQILSADPSAKAEVNLLTVNGNLSDATINGDVNDLEVHGNVDGGAIVVTGHVGTLHATGTIGHTGNLDNNAFLADGETISITGGFDTLTGDAGNFGLRNITISNGSYLSWTTNDGLTVETAYIQKGTAKLTINNGFLQTVTLAAGNNNNFLVTLAPNLAETNATDAKVTKKGVSASKDKALAARAGTTRKGLATIVAGANVGSIITGNSGVTSLTNSAIEGNVGSFDLWTNGSVSTLTIVGSLVGADGGNAGKGISDVIIKGNATKLTSAGSITGLHVKNIDRISAAGNFSNSTISGNAGVVSSGATLSNTTITGSAISIGAASIQGLSVGGSIGLEVSGVVEGPLDLGVAFTSEDAQRILGSSDLASIANPGPNDTLFIGGLNSKSGNKNISVSGEIAELRFSKPDKAVTNLIGQVVDDVIVGTGKTTAFLQKDGVIISPAHG